MAFRKQDPALPKIGARLALTRRALDLTRFQMARLLGTDMATWGAYEAGIQRIPADQALKLSPYGIPLEWIYQGRMADLHPHIRAKIRELQREAGRVRAARQVKRTAPGASWTARAVLLAPEQAATIAVGRWDNEPLKNALLKQSNDARAGLVCVAVGAGFQIVSKLIEEFFCELRDLRFTSLVPSG